LAASLAYNSLRMSYDQADRVLRTAPNPDDVSPSPTARTLIATAA
jgi:hypothetical protein